MDSIHLRKSRLRIVVFTIFLNIAAVIVFSNLAWSNWRTGMALNLLDNAILLTYAWLYRDDFIKHLLLFGLALGVAELAADAWLVDYTRTLDYSIGGGPIVWRSPLWMPFAWQIVAVQFAVLGLWLVERYQLMGLILTALLGAINIPFYEEMALKTKWWSYSNCRMISHTPYYIILGEFLIVIGIVLLARRVEARQTRTSIIAGLWGGVVIFVSYAVSFWIFK